MIDHKVINTRKIRNEITNNKEDKLTYDKESEIYTFKMKTCDSAGYVVGGIRFALQQYEPEFLEYYESTKSWKPKVVTIKFYLRNKEDSK